MKKMHYIFKKQCKEGIKHMENACLWVKPKMERITLIKWLIENDVEFNKTAGTEELRQLYIRKECGG